MLPCTMALKKNTEVFTDLKGWPQCLKGVRLPYSGYIYTHTCVTYLEKENDPIGLKLLQRLHEYVFYICTQKSGRK